MDQYDDPFLWPEFSGFVDWESLFKRHREEELLDILETLVRRGFDIDKPSIQMKTAMHKAVYYGYVELKRFLIEQETYIRRKAYRSSLKALARREKVSLNYTPLHYAARNDSSEMVKLLLDYADYTRYNKRNLPSGR
jgi:ankyrin repeat protein